MKYIECVGLPQWVKEVTINYGDDVTIEREGDDLNVWYEDEGVVATYECGNNTGWVRNPL